MFLSSKRFWKTAALCCAIGVMILLLAYSAVTWWAGARLESRLCKLRAAGEPTSLADLEVPVPVDDNAALVLAEVRSQLEAFSKAQATFDKTPQGAAYRESAFKTEEPTKEQIDMIRSILAMYPEVPGAIEKAAECNYHVTPLDYSLKSQYFIDQLNHSMTLNRNASRFCSWQIALAIADEDFDKAARVGINTLRLARLYDQEPLINSGLVALAVRGVAVRDLNRVLRSGDLSPETRLALDQELARHDDPMWFVKLLKTERAYSLDASGGLFNRFPMTWQGHLLKADTLQMYEELLPNMAKPWHESQGDVDDPINRSYSTPISTAMIKLYAPALKAAHEAYHRTIAQIRCLRILNALQTYKQENGREVGSLADLNLPASALVDPFDGKQLKLTRIDQGWLIYSAHRNRKDDGGDFENDNDRGIAPIGYPGAD